MDTTYGEAFRVAATGFSVVFITIVALMIGIKIMSYVIGLGQRKKRK